MNDFRGVTWTINRPFIYSFVWKEIWPGFTLSQCGLQGPLRLVNKVAVKVRAALMGNNLPKMLDGPLRLWNPTGHWLPVESYTYSVIEEDVVSVKYGRGGKSVVYHDSIISKLNTINKRIRDIIRSTVAEFHSDNFLNEGNRYGPKRKRGRSYGVGRHPGYFSTPR